MLHDPLKFAIGLALIAFAIISAMGLVMYLPYIAQSVLFAMH
jgi:hypothetical protein